ncbi:acyltransferase family protein [Mycobacterium xenopi 3993]|nr:acyltransferase family protein [Mycobacterium xenopi 3993]
MEPVYGTIIQLARLTWRIQGLRFTVTGVEHLPETGGAVVAINHTSYFDFTFAGLPAYLQGRGRKVRFMAKQDVFDHKISGPIMRKMRHIPVDRENGAASFHKAVEMLKAGELVGVYPRRRSAAASRSRNSSPERPGWRSRRTCRSSRTSCGAPADLDQRPPQEAVSPQGADRGGRRRADPTDPAGCGADHAAAFADAALAGTRAGVLRAASGR